MFEECSSLKSLTDISKWNTKNLAKMDYIFKECKLLISLPDISKWNTSNVTSMYGIFEQCSSLESLPDITKWDISKINNFSNFTIFINCSSLKYLLIYQSGILIN